MKKTILALSLAVLSIGASGCVDTTTPEGAVKAAYHYMTVGQPLFFRSTLAEPARSEYGNPEGMSALAQKLAGMKLLVQSAAYLGGERSDWGNKTVYHYSVPVFTQQLSAPTSPFVNTIEARVNCTVGYRWVTDTTGIEPGRGGVNRTRERKVSCFVSELRFL